MQIIDFSLDELTPYEHNPRLNDKAVKAVAQSIKTFGFKIPIVIDSAGVIVCGHTRYKAALKLKLESVPCIIADDLTPEQVNAFRLIDNKTAELAEWDAELLGEELKSFPAELVAEYNFDSPTQEDSPYVDIPASVSKSEKSTGDFETITFMFSAEQKQAVETALVKVAPDVKETFGNRNKNGNALYEVVRQWAEQKKLS